MQVVPKKDSMIPARPRSISHSSKQSYVPDNQLNQSPRLRSSTVGITNQPDQLLTAKSLDSDTTTNQNPMIHNNQFALFRRNDIKPKLQRKFLHALNQRHLLNKDSVTSSKVVQDAVQKSDKAGKRIGLGSKLNALLRTKKQKRTRSGILLSLHLAIVDRQTSEAINLLDLLSDSTLLKKRTFEANRAFLNAMVNGMEEFCIYMMGKGFPTNVNNAVLGQTPQNGKKAQQSGKEKFTFPSYFQLAVSMSLMSLVKVMIKAKADVNISWYQVTPLQTACVQGNESMARLLVENGANLNQTLSMTDFFLLTRLNLSSKGHPNRSANSSSDSPMTRTFKESYRQYGQRGPIVFPQDYIDCKEIFPYELAMAADHHALGVLLLENTNYKSIEKSSFGLFLAKDVSTVRLLLQAGAKTTVKDASGSTPLHLAARRGMIEIVIALVLAGADVNSKGLNGWTPLHEAASYCHSLTAHYLIHKGSSIQNLNNNEETPMELATRVGMDQATLDVIFNQPPDSIMFEQKERNLQISSQVPMELVSRKEKSKFPGLNFLRSSSNLGLFPADGTPADGKSEKSLATNMSSTSTSKTASTNGSQKRSLFGKNSKANIKKE